MMESNPRRSSALGGKGCSRDFDPGTQFLMATQGATLKPA
jgi:hypothetical protein